MNDRPIVRKRVEELLHKKGDRLGFADSDLLISTGRLESIDVIELVVYLEERYGIDFGERGFDQNQLDSIDSILVLIGTE